MIDVATGKRRVLLSVPEYNFESPRVSPDGRFIVCLRETQNTPAEPADVTLVVLDVDGSGASGESGRDLLPGLDRWPQEPAWSPDSRMPSTSRPTTAAAGRCSASTWRPARSPA